MPLNTAHSCVVWAAYGFFFLKSPASVGLYVCVHLHVPWSNPGTLPHHFKLSAFRYHLPARRSACPYLPESALQGCPCPARVPLCQTFISQHPNGSVTLHKPSSVTRRRRQNKGTAAWIHGEICIGDQLSRFKNSACFQHIL